MEAARVLGVRKDRRAVERLARAAAEGGPEQCLSIRMLGEIGDPGAFEPLQALLNVPEFLLRREVVMALRKIDNARAVDLLHEQLEEIPGAEGDRLAHALAGIDLLNAAQALVRKVRTSGDRETLARAVSAARDALQEHRARLEALRTGGGPPEVGSDDEGQAGGAGTDPGRAASEAGLDVIRALEALIRDLGRGR